MSSIINSLFGDNSEDRPAIPSKKIHANKEQRDICTSLASSWIVAMMKGENTGEAWCATINNAPADGELYRKHKDDQAELTSAVLLNQVKKVTQVFKIAAALTDLGPVYAQNLVGLHNATLPVLLSLQDKTTDKIKLLRVRGLKVSRSKSGATLDDLKEEFAKVKEEPRYYLFAVKATVKSHTIAVVSTLRPGTFFGTNGALYYYDPNLFWVLKFDDASELLRFLDKTLLVDYRGVNSIWELTAAAPK